MKILNLCSEKLNIKIRLDDIVESKVFNETKALIAYIKKNSIDIVIFDARTQESIINEFKLKNDLFPALAVISLKNYKFPKEMNPFYCLSADEFGQEYTYKNIVQMIKNYNNIENKAKNDILLDISNAKDYQRVSDADQVLHKISWGKYKIPKRKNPLLEIMDKMIKTSNQILEKLKDQ